MEFLKETYIVIIVVASIYLTFKIMSKAQSGDWTTKWFDAGGRSGSGCSFTILVMCGFLYLAREIYLVFFT